MAFVTPSSLQPRPLSAFEPSPDEFRLSSSAPLTTLPDFGAACKRVVAMMVVMVVMRRLMMMMMVMVMMLTNTMMMMMMMMTMP